MPLIQLVDRSHQSPRCLPFVLPNMPFDHRRAPHMLPMPNFSHGAEFLKRCNGRRIATRSGILKVIDTATGGLGRELLAGSLASGALTGCLLLFVLPILRNLHLSPTLARTDYQVHEPVTNLPHV